jgi:hypothetical protein
MEINLISRTVNSLRELQSASKEELRHRRTLMPSVLDIAFKGEL